jgi:hypothetical protein
MDNLGSFAVMASVHGSVPGIGLLILVAGNVRMAFGVGVWVSGFLPMVYPLYIHLGQERIGTSQADT